MRTGKGQVLDHAKYYGSPRREDEDERPDRRYRDDEDQRASRRRREERRDDEPAGRRGALPARRDYNEDEPDRSDRFSYLSYSRDDEDDEPPRYRPTRRARSDDDDDGRRAPRPSGGRGGSRQGGSGTTVIAPRATSRAELARISRLPDIEDDDEDDDETSEEAAGAYARAGFASVAWFAMPLGAFLLWAVFLGGTARADCVDAGGRPCPAPREAAFATFYAHLPQVGVAVVLSVLIALFIRLLAPLWRPSTIGFAASVVGAGVTTVVFTVLNGSG